MVTEIHFNDILDRFDLNDPNYFEKAARELARICEVTPDGVVILDIGRTFGVTVEEGQVLRLHTVQGDVDLVKGQEHMVGTLDNFRGISILNAAQREDSEATRAIDEQNIKL